MKITHIETIILSRLHEPERQWITSTLRIIKADCAIVLVHTDEGLTGIGEACAYGNPARIREWAAWLAPELVGKDPCRPETAPHPNGRSAAYDCTVAGIDSALWDLRGQIEGKRVSELLKPGALEKVRLYASSGCRYDWRYNPNQLIEEALGYISQGYTAMKLRLGTQWAWDGVTVDRFLGLMGELDAGSQRAHGANAGRQPAPERRPGPGDCPGAEPVRVRLVRGTHPPGGYRRVCAPEPGSGHPDHRR